MSDMNNIIEIFQYNVKNNPDKIAVIFQEKHYTYTTLESDVKRMSKYLEKFNIQKSTHIILLLDNSYEYILCMLSIANLGAVLIPLNTTMKPAAINKAIESTNTTHIITNHSLKNCFGNASALNIDNSNIIAVDQDLSETDIDGYLLNQSKVSYKEDYILTMTSGSTGDPKPIVFTQETKITRSLLGARDLYNLDNNEVIIAASPLYHSLGQRLVLLPLLIGGTSVLLKKFTPQIWIQTVKRTKVTFTIAIASHLEILVDMLANETALNSLRTIVSSSSLLKPDIKKKCIERFNCDFHECYGASEVGIVTNLSPEDAKKSINSVGLPLKFVDLKIVDNNKNEVSCGTIGEIICKSQTAFSRYYNNESKTKESVIDGYFYTGDLGYLDGNGFLYLSGRKKEIIIVGGTNVYPVDIESVIGEVEGVKECSVIGVEDTYFGEAILAVLVVDQNSFNLKDVKVSCIKNLADYQQPMAFEIVEKLPKNNLGKIMKHELQKMFQGYDATKGLRKLIQKKG